MKNLDRVYKADIPNGDIGNANVISRSLIIECVEEEVEDAKEEIKFRLILKTRWM